MFERYALPQPPEQHQPGHAFVHQAQVAPAELGAQLQRPPQFRVHIGLKADEPRRRHADDRHRQRVQPQLVNDFDMTQSNSLH